MAKLQSCKNQFTITIPKIFIEMLKWKKGDEIFVSVNEMDNIVLSNMDKEKKEKESKHQKKTRNLMESI
jgi:antitoxin component of MazEF toxin-antitoxin module